MKALEDLSLRYDNSVRNSENTVVQFTYGDDSLSPVMMENNSRPVEFDRLRLHVSQTFPCSEEPNLLKDQLLNKIEGSLCEARFQRLLPNGRIFLTEIESFFKDIVAKQEKAIESCLNDAFIQQRTWNSCRFTETQVNEFLRVALTKYTKGVLLLYICNSLIRPVVFSFLLLIVFVFQLW